MTQGNKTEVTTELVLGFIKNATGLPEKVIGQYLGLSPASLVNSKKNPLSEVTHNKTGRRIMTLYHVIKGLYEKGYSPIMTTQAVTAQLFRGLEGRMESVATLIQQEKYDHQILLEIALKAVEKLQEEINSKNRSLYESIEMACH